MTPVRRQLRSRSVSQGQSPNKTPRLQDRSKSPTSEVADATGSSTSQPRSRGAATRNLDEGAAQERLGSEANGEMDLSLRGLYGRVGNELLTSQAHVQRVQWACTASAGIGLNLGQIKKTIHNEGVLLTAYREQVKGFAEQYLTFMRDPQGGQKPISWFAGKDASWFERRLLNKHKDCQEKGVVDGVYVWNQWLHMRSQIDNEAMIAWNTVTKNGTQVIASGCDAMQTHDRMLQAWYEASFRSAGAVCDSLKKSNDTMWAKLGVTGEHAQCVLHGADCLFGRVPSDWRPKAYLVFCHMGPPADILGPYYAFRMGPEAGFFPPYNYGYEFRELFSALKSTDGPPAPGAHGGAHIEHTRITPHGFSNMSRSAQKMKDRAESPHDEDVSDDESEKEKVKALKALTRSLTDVAGASENSTQMHVSTDLASIKSDHAAVNNLFLTILQHLVATYQAADASDFRVRMQRLQALQHRIQEYQKSGGAQALAEITAKVTGVTSRNDVDGQLFVFD